jgi:hypothetical protein
MENKKINWLNIIIINEFQNILNLNLLINLSLLSKKTREKLKPLIFNKLELTNIDFELKITHSNNLFVEYFKSLESESSSDDSIIENKFCEILNIEDSLTDISYSLKNIKYYTKSVSLEDISRAGYYLFSIVSNFCNLTQLKLNSCYIPYSGLVKLGEYLPKLTNIELISVILAKSGKDNVSLSDYIFPKNLRYLRFISNNITSTESLPDPIEFLINDKSSAIFETYFIPNISIPSLNYLEFYGMDPEKTKLIAFLDANPNLDSLKIFSIDSKLIKKLSSLKCLEFNGVESIDTSENTNNLYSLSKLTINGYILTNLNDIKSFCLLCPNLEYLHFKNLYTDSFQEYIDKLLAPILLRLTKLKTLRLLITTNNEILDISKLEQIEELIIDASSEIVLNLNLENCKFLKKIIINLIFERVNTDHIKHKFNNLKSWKFKFCEDTIIGYKINN